MERLTKHYPDNLCDYGDGEISDEKLNDIYCKLQEFEDLEEQLGCPLDVFIKLISTGELWCEDERMHFNGGDYGKLVGSPKWKERFKCETAPIHFSFDDEDLKETEFWAWYHYCSNGSDHIVLKLKDYKKTWWLQKDKSE